MYAGTLKYYNKLEYLHNTWIVLCSKKKIFLMASSGALNCNKTIPARNGYARIKPSLLTLRTNDKNVWAVTVGKTVSAFQR